jgi:hypothetical protein
LSMKSLWPIFSILAVSSVTIACGVWLSL